MVYWNSKHLPDKTKAGELYNLIYIRGFQAENERKLRIYD